MDKNKLDTVIRALQGSEELLHRSHLLLYRLSHRCQEAASKICTKDTYPTKEDTDTADFLYEISQTLQFISEAMGVDSDHVDDVLRDLNTGGDVS